MTNGWQKKPLGELCQFRPPKSEARKRLSPSDRVSFFGMENLGIDQKYPQSEHVRSLGEVSGSYTYFAEGDVLLAKITPCFQNGKLGIARNLTNGVGFGSSEFIVIRPAPELDREFLYYFLSREDFRTEGVMRMGGSVGQQRVPNEFIQGQLIPLLPMPEQRRIVGILDKAFEGIATARANAETNLQNARALFESHLHAVFTQRGNGELLHSERIETDRLGKGQCAKNEDGGLNGARVTKTGGREATLRHIPGPLSLAVGMPKSGARRGWQWTSLSDLARLESGHTPSRKHPEYWGGSIPWIGIRDAREHHGCTINETLQNINELGIANSSSRMLPKHTVCLSRTASVGYVMVTGRPMATSQDFVNWVCRTNLLPEFLMYIFLAESREGLLRYASGSVHQTIYFPEAKAFYICHPDVNEQSRIVRQCDAMRAETQRLESLYHCKLAALDALKKSLLHQAFSGQL